MNPIKRVITSFKDFLSDGDYSKSEEAKQEAERLTMKDGKTRWVVDTNWSGIQIVDVEPSDEDTIIYTIEYSDK
jgi:hypothetical protein